MTVSVSKKVSSSSGSCVDCIATFRLAGVWRITFLPNSFIFRQVSSSFFISDFTLTFDCIVQICYHCDIGLSFTTEQIHLIGIHGRNDIFRRGEVAGTTFNGVTTLRRNCKFVGIVLVGSATVLLSRRSIWFDTKSTSISPNKTCTHRLNILGRLKTHKRIQIIHIFRWYRESNTPLVTLTFRKKTCGAGALTVLPTSAVTATVENKSVNTASSGGVPTVSPERVMVKNENLRAIQISSVMMLT